MGAVEFEWRVYLDNAAVEGLHCVHLLDEALELTQIGLVTEGGTQVNLKLYNAFNV